MAFRKAADRFGGGEIQTVNSLVNLDKLDHIGRVADLRALLARGKESRD